MAKPCVNRTLPWLSSTCVRSAPRSVALLLFGGSVFDGLQLTNTDSLEFADARRWTSWSPKSTPYTVLDLQMHLTCNVCHKPDTSKSAAVTLVSSRKQIRKRMSWRWEYQRSLTICAVAGVFRHDLVSRGLISPMSYPLIPAHMCVRSWTVQNTCAAASLHPLRVRSFLQLLSTKRSA